MRLNLGSGFVHLDGFLSVDIDPECHPAIVADMRDLKPIVSKSIDEIFTAHALEHIPSQDLFKTLRQFYRVLKHGGRLTIIVPDCQQASKDWIFDKIDFHKFKSILMGSDPSVTKYMPHFNLFFDSNLARYLFITGFTDIDISRNTKTYEITAIAYKPKENKNATSKSTSRNR